MVARSYSFESGFKSRIVALTVLLLLAILIIIARLVFLQIIKGPEYRIAASSQRTSVRQIQPKRGEIKIADALTGEPYTVATSIERPLVYGVPSAIKNLDETAGKLAELLSLDKTLVREKLSDQNKKYVPLKKSLTDEEKQRVESAHLEGIAFDSETVRYYPEQGFLSQVLGYVGYQDEDRVGRYGVEQAFEDLLKGNLGKLAQERDVFGAWIFGAKRDGDPAVDGDDLLLTIDKGVQFKAESVLKDAVEKNLADSGSIVVMDPKTGAMLAMANYPTFDPNQYNKVTDLSVFTNSVTSGNYEPGSIFKPITIAAALNEKTISPSTTFNDTGAVSTDGYTIRNSDKKANGLVDISKILEKSINTGTIFAKESIGNKKFLEYVKKFGFGEKTGIELAETRGDLRNLNENININYHTASFGQGIQVTPLQMVQAYSAFANQGKMMRPFILKSKVSPDGKVITTEPKVVDQVISSETASTVSAMLVNVVEKGHGKRAGVPGYYIAGKTGTAQVARKDGGGYEENNNIGSFIGFGPVEDPRFIMLVRVNHPRTVNYAESTAAPAFGQMAEFMLKYFNIPPTRD